jgi:hypothetical protein
MATIVTTDFINYSGGDSSDGVYSSIVGYEGGKTRCVRFKFKSPSVGASHVAISGKFSFGNGEKNAPRWYITTSATSHANACADAAYHGTLAMTNPDGVYRGSGEADIVLLPNTTYYLWLFPPSTTFGWWAHYESFTIETSGGAGLVYIDNGSSFDAYMVYIDNGTSWDPYIPYIDNGSSWDICS